VPDAPAGLSDSHGDSPDSRAAHSQSPDVGGTSGGPHDYARDSRDLARTKDHKADAVKHKSPEHKLREHKSREHESRWKIRYGHVPLRSLIETACRVAGLRLSGAQRKANAPRAGGLVTMPSFAGPNPT